MRQTLGLRLPSSKRAWWAFGVTLAAAGTLWTLIGVNVGADPVAGSVPAGPGTPIVMSRPEPYLARPLLAGSGSFRLSEQRGSVVVLNFWASWCHACRKEASVLNATWREYRDRGVRFVGIDFEDNPRGALAAIRSFGMRYPSISDPNGTAGDAFDILGLPSTYIIGRNGVIRYRVIGAISPTSFRVALESVLARTGAEGSSS